MLEAENFVHRVHRDLQQKWKFRSISFWIKVRIVFEFEVFVKFSRMPPRRANRHQNVEALYRREEADEMEQRINENFSEKLNEGIGRLEKMMLEMNQNRRRVSPESNHGGSRVSPHSNRDRSIENDQGRGRNVNDRERRNVDRRDVGGRREGSRDVGG